MSSRPSRGVPWGSTRDTRVRVENIDFSDAKDARTTFSAEAERRQFQEYGGGFGRHTTTNKIGLGVDHKLDDDKTRAHADMSRSVTNHGKPSHQTGVRVTHDVNDRTQIYGEARQSRDTGKPFSGKPNMDFEFGIRKNF